MAGRTFRYAVLCLLRGMMVATLTRHILVSTMEPFRQWILIRDGYQTLYDLTVLKIHRFKFLLQTLDLDLFRSLLWIEHV